MQCPRCNAPNDDTARFCGDCGARIELGCPACGQPVGVGKRFCWSCGAPLAPGAAAPVAPTPPHLARRILTGRGALEGERKQVTVLFADLKGSMELLAGRDPEEARRVLDPVLERMIEAVHRHEGTVNQVLGDGIMAIFGAPLAHEDHALRACCAALAMQEGLRDHAAAVRRSADVPLLVRVGLNSGEVVVRSIAGDLHMEYTAVGQTTHLAARMEQMAVPGTVLLTVHTARLVEGFVELRPLGPVPVKGLAEAVEAFEALRAEPTRTRLQVAVARGLTPLVGRDAELGALRAALERARAGHGQAVALVGEAGVGKSRLLWEAAHSPDTRDWRVLEAGPAAHGKVVPALPLLALLRAHLELGRDDDDPTVRRRVAAALDAADPALGTDLPALLALLDVPVDDVRWRGLDPPLRRQWTVDALTRLFLRDSRAHRPLLLVVEDLQWIDSETRAFLDALAARLGDAPLLLLVAYRPGHTHAWARHAWYTEIRLAPLDAVGAAALLGAVLGGEPELAPLARLLIERTEGNPFFIEECVRALVETGALLGERGAHRLARPVTGLQVPASVSAVLAARIDRLPAVDKALLQSASVIGRDVPLALLREIADLPEETLQASLASLGRAEFLYPTRVVPDAAYAFKHALTHEVAYGTLLRERRRALHARLVGLIDALGPGPGGQADPLALHALRGELWERALALLRQAGAAALARSAYHEAAASFTQALEALAHLPDTREAREQGVDLRFGLRHALLPIGEHERAFRSLQEAEAIAEALGDQRRTAWTLCYQTTYLWSSGDPEAAAVSGTRALAMADEMEDVPLRVVATIGLGWAHQAQGEYARAIAVFRRTLDALEGAPPGERFGLVGLPGVGARTWLAWCHAERGEFAEAHAHAAEAVRLAEAADHPFSRAIAYFGAALPYLWRDEPARAVPALERGLALCRQFEIRTWLTALASGLGHALARLGRPAEAIPLLREAVDVGVAIRSRFRHSQRVAWLAGALLEAGDAEGAGRLGDEALAAARAGRERGNEAHALHHLATIASARGDAAGAATYDREALALAESRGMRPLAARCQLGLARAARQRGDAAAAAAHAAAARALLDAMGMTVRAAR